MQTLFVADSCSVCVFVCVMYANEKALTSDSLITNTEKKSPSILILFSLSSISSNKNTHSIFYYEIITNIRKKSQYSALAIQNSQIMVVFFLEPCPI